MKCIETSHLKTWAASRPAESRFPYLIKSLICAVITPEKIRFPSGDAVWVPGFDGVVQNVEKNRFVPTGQSLWEAGTGTNYKRKANEDYNKRSYDKESVKFIINRSEITFAFVTPLVWKDKDDWARERRDEGIWRDVVVIDGVDLQHWFEAAPAVNLQFAAEIGLVPEAGLQTPDQAWQDWCFFTDPPMTEELDVIGREEQAKELIERLLSEPQVFTVRGDSSREAWGFTLAALRHILSEEKRQSLCARTIVADDENIASRLRNLQNHIVLLKQSCGQVSGYLSSQGCHLIVSEGNDARSHRNVIFLSRSRPSHRLFSEELTRMGFDEESAEQMTRSCGLSVTIFQRQQAHANFVRPDWAKNRQVAAPLLPALLANRWNDRNEQDQQILCILANLNSYDDVVAALQEYIWVDERPLQKIDEMWALTAPVDAFQLLARYLTESDLLRFKDAFREVFGRIDPKVELAPDEWLYVDMKGKKGHSGWLRTGMAETLLLLAERGDDAEMNCLPSSSQAFIENVVRNLPGLKDDWRILASLRDQYARLMEAAPDPLLDSLENLLETKPQDIGQLFTEGDLAFGGGGMHTGLLWGLETLAWLPEYFSRVTLILAKLSSIDKGGRLVNRPINSLREIFLWWHPGTSAPLKQRLAALNSVLSQEPLVGWKLLTKLLPSSAGSISHPTSKPRWKDYGSLPEDLRTKQGQLIYLSKIVDLSLEYVGNDPIRWQAVLESLRVISNDQQQKALHALNEVVVNQEFTAAQKFQLWEILRDFVNNHRTYADAHWALPSSIIEKIETVQMQIAPEDPIDNYKWLFDNWLPELSSEEKSFDKRKKMAEKLRIEAIKEIYDIHSFQGIIELAVSCKLQGAVASASKPLLNNTDIVLEFVDAGKKKGDAGLAFISHISACAYHLFDNTWRETVQKEIRSGRWSIDVASALMLLWPDDMNTWIIVKDSGSDVNQEYWRRKPVFVIEGSPEDQKYYLENLITVGRAVEAFDRLALKTNDVPSDIMLQVLDAVFDQVSRAQSIEEIRSFGLKAYSFNEFFDELRKRPDIPRQEIARKEYQALPFFGSLDVRGLTIQDLIMEDPDFFIKVICEVYLPENSEREDAEPTTEDRNRALLAYRLLNGIEKIPGLHGDNGIDETGLMEWIYEVRKKAVEVDRAEITDLKIGEILAHAPPDPEDGGWPHQTIRNVIESLATNTIGRGLMTERHNMRGVVTKALFEGGAQERELAKQYQGWAEISRAQWPRMANVLDSITRRYKEEARREDARAEQDKLR